MTYKLKVCPGETDVDTGDYTNFFENFMSGSGYYDSDSNGGIDFYLKKYRAKNIPNSPYIQFETEADATWFVLEWS